MSGIPPVKDPLVLASKIIPFLWTCSSLVFAQASDSIHPASSQDTSTARRGVLCIDKLPGPQFWASFGKGSGTGNGPSSETRAARLKERPIYFATIDNGALKEFSQTNGNCIPDLSIEQRHTIRILDDGKRQVASFRFRFDPGVAAKHLSFDAFYTSWSLENVPKRRIEKALGAAHDGATCSVCQ
jgi:hypothetical protein